MVRWKLLFCYFYYKDILFFEGHIIYKTFKIAGDGFLLRDVLTALHYYVKYVYRFNALYLLVVYITIEYMFPEQGTRELDTN